MESHEDLLSLDIKVLPTHGKKESSDIITETADFTSLGNSNLNNQKPVSVADTPNLPASAVDISLIKNTKAVKTKEIAIKSLPTGPKGISLTGKASPTPQKTVFTKDTSGVHTTKSDDIEAPAGASSGPTLAVHGGAGGREMSKSGVPENEILGASAFPGMPDMMKMMLAGVMPDGIKTMMSKLQGAGGRCGKMDRPMGMREMFDCIVEVSLLSPDSDVSDDDEDSIPIILPCQYCSRIFASNMMLKTHILVAHDKEDTSLLNLKKLHIDDKDKLRFKDRSSKRKHSSDHEKTDAEAASSHVKTAEHIVSKETALEVNISAAGPIKSMKKAKAESCPESVGSSGAAGVEECGSADYSQLLSVHLRPDADPCSCEQGGNSPESRKRKALNQMQHSSTEELSSKKCKNETIEKKHDSVLAKEPCTVLTNEIRESKDIFESELKLDTNVAQHRKIKSDLRRHKRVKDVESNTPDTGADPHSVDNAQHKVSSQKLADSDTDNASTSGDSATASVIVPSEVDSSLTVNRRSLRSRKTR